jgi:hypothetical protein
MIKAERRKKAGGKKRELNKGRITKDRRLMLSQN